MKWSFDDMHIGQIRPKDRSLHTRIIPNPGLPLKIWYEHASAVIKLLNAKDN